MISQLGRALRTTLLPLLRSLRWEDCALLACMLVGIGLCIATATGFDLFGTFWHTTTLLFPFVFVLFAGTRFLFIIPDGWEPKLSFAKTLVRFRNSDTDEVLGLDRTLAWVFFLFVSTITVYANLKIRLPVVRDSMYDDRLSSIGGHLLTSRFTSWLEDLAAINDVAFALLAMAFSGGFVLMGGLLFVLYIKRDAFHLRWLGYSLCFVSLSVIALSLLVPAVGPFLIDPARFQWLEGTQFLDNQRDLAQAFALAHDTSSDPESLRAHPLMGVASFPSLRVALLVVFTVVALRTARWYAPIIAVGAFMTALAGIAFGYHYVVDIFAALVLAAVITEVLYRLMRRRSGSSPSSNPSTPGEGGRS